MVRSTHDANRHWFALGVVAVALVCWVVVNSFAAESVVEDEPVEPQLPVAAVLYDLATRNGPVDAGPTNDTTGVAIASPNVPASPQGDLTRGSIGDADQVLGKLVEGSAEVVENRRDQIDEVVGLSTSPPTDHVGRGQRSITE